MKTCSECVAEINAKLGDYAQCYDAYQMVDQLFDFDESSGGFIEKIDPPDFWSVARDSKTYINNHSKSNYNFYSTFATRLSRI